MKNLKNLSFLFVSILFISCEKYEATQEIVAGLAPGIYYFVATAYSVEQKLAVQVLLGSQRL